MNFGNQIKTSKLIRIIHVTDKIEEQAWKIFEQYDEKDFSFTDCTSFAIMENENIQNVFTFDKHFTQYGFQIHPQIKFAK